jgi:hypothetical protein
MVRAGAASSYTESERLSVSVSASADVGFKGDLLVIPFYRPQGDNLKDDKVFSAELKKLIPSGLPSDIQSIVSEIIDGGSFKADASTKQVTRIGGANVKYVALVGLGANPKKTDSGDLEVQSANRLGKTVAVSAKETKAASVGVVLPVGAGNAGVTQFLLGVHDASYNDLRFKKVPEGGHKPNPLKSISLLGASSNVVSDIAVNHKLTDMIASGVSFARDLVGRYSRFQHYSIPFYRCIRYSRFQHYSIPFYRCISVDMEFWFVVAPLLQLNERVITRNVYRNYLVLPFFCTFAIYIIVVYNTVVRCLYVRIGAPPNSKTPVVIADLAKKLAADSGMQCTVLNKVQYERCIVVFPH